MPQLFGKVGARAPSRLTEVEVTLSTGCGEVLFFSDLQRQITRTHVDRQLCFALLKRIGNEATG